MTTGKTIALARWTFVGQVMSLLLNMLSRLVTTFLPRSKHLLISWLQSPSAVILDSPQIKSATVSTVGLIAHLCYNLTDYSPLGFSVHGILQARILEWVNCFLLQGLFLTQESNPGFMHWEKEMATHFSVLALIIPVTGEPGGLLSMGWKRVRKD